MFLGPVLGWAYGTFDKIRRPTQFGKENLMKKVGNQFTLRVSSALTALVLAGILLLTACGGGGAPSEAGGQSTAPPAGDSSAAAPSEAEQSEEPVVLEFWYEGSGPVRTEAFEGLLKEWNEANPNIQVNGTYIALDTAMDKVNVAIASDTLPDVMTIQGSWHGELFPQDIFVDLTDRFEAWEESSLFNPDFINVLRNNDPDGRLLAIPQAANLFGIWYRTDVYEEKELTSPAESWDALFDGIAATTDKANGIYGHTVRGGATSATQLLYVIISYVGLPEFFDEEGNAQMLRDPAAVEIVNRYADVFKNGEAPQSSLTASFKEMAADFCSGTSMSYIHNLGSYETVSEVFEPNQYAFIMFPKSPVTNAYTASMPTVKGNAMSVSCENQDAAWEFMKFWSSKASDGAINSVIGEFPVRLDTLEESWVAEAPQLKEAVPFMQDSTKVSVVNPDFLPAYSSIMAQTGEPNFQAVLTGSMTAEDFLDSIATPLEADYKEFYGL